MAGLLDFLDTEDGRLGLGLLAAAGPSMTPMSFGQRLAGAMQGYRAERTAAEERALKKQLAEAQIGNYASEVEARKAAIAKQEQIQRMVSSLFSGGGSGGGGSASPQQLGPATPGMSGENAPVGAWGGGDAGNASLGAASPQSRELRSRLAGMSIDQVAAIKAMGGPDLMDAWKAAQPNMQVHGGFAVDMNGLRAGFLPQMNIAANGQASLTTIGPDGLPRISAPQGAVETVGAYTGAQKRAENANTLLPTDYLGTDGRPMGGTVGQAVDYFSKNPPLGAGPKPAGQATLNLPGSPQEQFALISRIQDPAYRAEATAAWQRQFGGSNPAMPSINAGTPGVLGGKADQQAGVIAQELGKETTGKVNDAWLKGSYEPTVSAGQSATKIIENAQIARNALSNLGQTGWGTDIKAAAANVLTSLGLSSGNAKMYAANAEKFNAVAKDHVWALLAAQKGPQTEGDNKRAEQTYAKLSNVNESNAFILDLNQARAERDAMKARFYTAALPAARKSGSLQEIDKDWSERMPSIFDMPSMQRWK